MGQPGGVQRQTRAYLVGARDIAFRRKELNHSTGKLSNAQVHEFEEVGHFVAEQAPARILPLLREFLS